MKALRPLAILFFIIVLTSGCAYIPFVKTIYIDRTPKPQYATTVDNIDLINGYPKNKAPWIVYADRNKSRSQVSAQNDADLKQLGFMEPLYVLRTKGKLAKIAQYLPNVDIVQTNGGIPKKALKKLGWVSREKLLEWSSAFRNEQNGFHIKAVITPNNSDVILHAKTFMDHDSALTFLNPYLTSATDKKIGINQVVYIYKQSEDKNAFLIGKKPTLSPDSAASNIYGWISNKMISLWGDRIAIKLLTNTNETAPSDWGIYKKNIDNFCKENEPNIAVKDATERMPFEDIFPVNTTKGIDTVIDTKFFTNILNYDKNKIYNVLGNPIYYSTANEITTNGRKLNVVFVVDFSQNNRLYLPIVKSLLQDLQLYFETPSFFTSTKFGAVVYKQNECGVKELTSPLSNNYIDLINFINKREEDLNCADQDIYQPVSKGLLNACKLLADVKDETNLIIQIGTTANEPGADIYSKVTNAITNVRGRTIFFQTTAKTADAYNDFVLFSQKVVSNTAQNISELKKEKLVNQSDVLTEADYSLSAGDSGIYHLDFPSKSMVQGYVIFPKKGEIMQSSILKRSIDSILSSITADNKSIENNLHTYFKAAFGVNNTEIKNAYACQFKQVSNPVPTDFATQFSSIKNPFLLSGNISKQLDTLSPFCESGILIDDEAYEKLYDYYMKIYQETVRKTFKRKKSIKRYLQIVKANNPTLYKTSIGYLSKQNIAYASLLNMGYRTRDTFQLNHTLKSLRKSDAISNETVRNFMKNFKRLADKLSANKSNPNVRIPWNGQYFYWLNKDYMPSDNLIQE